MKINSYIRKSLSRKFLFLVGGFIAFLAIGAIVLLIIFNQMNQAFLAERDLINKKEKIVEAIKDDYNQAFLDARGYVAFGNKVLKDNALEQGTKIKKLEEQYKKMASSQEEREFSNQVYEFTHYYFANILPKMIVNYESGNVSDVLTLANGEATPKVQIFQKKLNEQLLKQDIDLENQYQKLIRFEENIQIGFILSLSFVLVSLLLILNYMFRKIGQPLSHLAAAANEIANGNDSSEYLGTTREDEIGRLSSSFQRMAEKVQEKERDLLAQNEELIAQQDELQVQQTELENAIELHRENEAKLKNRNHLINHISHTLNKQEVLDSVVTNMCKIIEADKGIITDIQDSSYSSFRVSDSAVQQFLALLKNGSYDHIIKTIEPFTIRRELRLNEKGYHEEVQYCHDLYLPVLSSAEEVIAVMIFTRFGGPFHSEQMEEFKALSRTIGNSLERITLYQNSEEERKRNQDILNTLQEGVQLVDRTGRTLLTNDYLCEMYHCKENFVGMNFDEWIIRMQQYVNEEGLTSFLQKSLKEINSKSAGIQQYVYTMENPFRVIKMYSKGLFHDIEKIGTVFVHLDITKEYEVDQMKSEFVSTVSHELRTPLSSILGFTELLLNREQKPERQKKYLTTIYNEAKRLTSLINDFLDVQRMESGRQTYEKKYIPLLPLLNKVIEAQQVTTKHHEFRLEDEGGNPTVLGDRTKIEQAFTNLINNAVKYSPAGGEIVVRVTEENHLIRVDVIDQGLGIPEDAIPKLFQKFYRVDNSDRRSIGGTGLGLSIVQEIIKEHEGEIGVQSNFEKGSIFTVTLPAVQIEETETATELDKDSASKYHIVVIEDDPSLSELINQELRENGFIVNSFTNASESQHFLETATPDAIVLDILLGDEKINGWDIMKMLKSSEMQKNIPIIVSTALDEKEKSFSLGAKDFLVKPYHPSQLSKTIMQTLLQTGKAGQILVPQQNNEE
jgi:signal transduction histidine kinase/CheY-like chemotaxis protein/HAMP domain-containing protein